MVPRIETLVRSLCSTGSGWRLPFMLQWVWPLPLFIGCYLAPESPWWLCRQDRMQEAEESLRRLATGTEVEPERLRQKVAGMAYTTAMEKPETASATYLDCFKDDNLRRTEIVSLILTVLHTPSRTDENAVSVLCGVGNSMVVWQSVDWSSCTIVSLPLDSVGGG